MTEAALQQLQSFLNEKLANQECLLMLEAGCGSATYLKLKPKTHFVGIDISEEQLERNQFVDEKILGDIQYYRFPADLFDAIICWNVLEHVPKPDLALQNFAIALKPGGLLILSLPNLYSVKGMTTRLTPHWMHVLMYRYGYRIKDAGKDGRAPFKTYLRRSISPNGILKFAQNNRMDLVYKSFYNISDYLGTHNRILGKVYKLIDRFARAISAGWLGDSEFYMVLSKKNESPISLPGGPLPA